MTMLYFGAEDYKLFSEKALDGAFDQMRNFNFLELYNMRYVQKYCMFML